MNYISTRGGNEVVTSAQAIKQGIASNGGLFMPERIPALTSQNITELLSLTYQQRAAKILSMFLEDYTEAELLGYSEAAYGKQFVGGEAPVVAIDSNLKVLELWHGPTCAFKDMALQIMPRLLSGALEKTGEKRQALILVATSGDTGKAALEGYKDVKNISIMVFYPENGVSKAQKQQMITQEGANVNVCAIKGNFDDAQSGVKKIFGDKEFAKALDEKGFFLSSANSINWGRLAPQIVYYVSAYCDLVNQKQIKQGDVIDVCVPTGNFGNILAAYIAKKMGLPVGKLICASNRNNVLTDFLNTGVYDRNREFHLTVSPSMDILISSNLERLLYLVAGPEKCAQYMKELSENGRYEVDANTLASIKEDFAGYFCGEDDCLAEIANTFDKNGYLADTHTAVALHCAREAKSDKATVVASTASPYKFAPAVAKALGLSDKGEIDELFVSINEKSGMDVPKPLTDVLTKDVRFTKVIEVCDMPASVLDFTKSLA